MLAQALPASGINEQLCSTLPAIPEGLPHLPAVSTVVAGTQSIPDPAVVNQTANAISEVVVNVPPRGRGSKRGRAR